ncbi:MAG: hypothetical protein JWO80_4520 [Bryobacterales bacterium]|nr:hypothetical protein [Bryobacterales bacterium]
MVRLISQHFRQISAGSPTPHPLRLGTLFLHQSHDYSGTAGLAEQVRRLATEVGQQGQVVGELASVVTGKGSALTNAGSSLLGGSILGGAFQSAASGFSWQSLLKDIVPLGGLVSEIAGLFSSPAAPPPLQQYDAPMPLSFSGVLGVDGKISQASGNRSGNSRASSPGLDLNDAAGGPQPAYTRGLDGSLDAVAGAPTTRYSGTLDLSSVVRGLVPPGENRPQTGSGAPSSGQTTVESTQNSGPGPASMPAFDGPWFMDHAPYIAAAVRNAMLEYHPIVDVVNDL